MFETNAIFVPSGENVGDQHEPVFAIRATVRSNSSAAGVSAHVAEASAKPETSAKPKRMFFIEYGSELSPGQRRDRFLHPAYDQGESIVVQVLRRVRLFVVMRITKRRRVCHHDRRITALPERPMV